MANTTLYILPERFADQLLPPLAALLYPQTHLAPMPSGKYSRTTYPALIDLLSTAEPTSPAGVPGASGFKSSAPVSLEVLDIREEFGVSSPASWREWIDHLLRTPDFWSDENQVRELIHYLNCLHSTISNLFYPPVPVSHPTLPCPVCGEKRLATTPEPEYTVWCEACQSDWQGDSALRLLIAQIRGEA